MPWSFSLNFSCVLKLSMYAKKNFKFISYAEEVILLMSYIMKTIGGEYQAIGGMGALAPFNFGQKGALA